MTQNGFPTAGSPWWQDIVRFRVPVLGLAMLLFFALDGIRGDLLGLQRHMGELGERMARIEGRVTSIEDRLARLETLMEAHFGPGRPAD